MNSPFIPIGDCTNAGIVKAVGLLLCDEHGRLILQLRDNWDGLFAKGRWCIFGGGVDAGEDPKTACIREIAEEIGLDIDASDIEPYSYHLGIAPDFDQHYIFRMKQPIPLNEIRLCEGAGFGAFDKGQIDALALSPNLAPAILHFAKHEM